MIVKEKSKKTKTELLIKNDNVNDNISIQSFLLEGEAGVGKTYLAEHIAKKLEANFHFLLCHSLLSSEDVFQSLNPKAFLDISVPLYNDKVLYNVIKDSILGKTVLLLDEIDKGSEDFDNLLLDYFQNFRYKGLEGNKDNIIIFLTSNKTRELSLPLQRRYATVQINKLSRYQIYDTIANKANFHFCNNGKYLIDVCTKKKVREINNNHINLCLDIIYICGYTIIIDKVQKLLNLLCFCKNITELFQSFIFIYPDFPIKFKSFSEKNKKSFYFLIKELEIKK